MDNRFFIYIGIIFFIFFIFNPVPYCRSVGDQIPPNKTIFVYTTEEMSEVRNLTIVLLHVRGESMLPTIQDGDECLCTKKKDYKVGDIIFFFAKIKGEAVGISHRIVEINQEGIFTKGDNNDWIDPPLTEENIVCSIPTVPRYHIIF